MKTCDDMRPALADLLFGELAPEVEMELNDHLATCAPCRNEERRLIGIRDVVHGQGWEAGPVLRERIRHALPPRRASAVLGVFGRPVPAYVAGLACLVGAVAVFLVLRGEWSGARATAPASRPVARSLADPMLPFIPAGSYDTGVAMAGPGATAADTAARAGRRGQDSL